MNKIMKMIATAAVGLCASATVCAQVPLTIPAGAGGQNHRVAIGLQKYLADWIGQPVVFDFRPGGFGGVAARHMKQSTLPAHFLLQLGQTRADYEIDQLTELVPVIEVGTIRHIIYVRSTLGIKTYNDLANSAPGKKISYGVVHGGGLEFFQRGFWKTTPNIDPVEVLYKTGANKIADILGGHLDVGLSGESLMQQYAAEGRIIPLIVTSNTRSKIYPTVPTMAELKLKFPNDSHKPIYFLWATKSTDPAMIDRIKKAFAQWMVTDEAKQVFEGFDSEPPTPAQAVRPEIALTRLLGR